MESSSFDNIRASRVEGTEVYNRTGEHLGQIDDLVIGKRDGDTVTFDIHLQGDKETIFFDM